MRGFDRDLIRGGHYGQRSCEPHLKAEQHGRTDQCCEREESACQLGAVHTLHEATDSTALNFQSLLGVLRTWMNLRPPVSRSKMTRCFGIQKQVVCWLSGSGRG